MGAHSDSINVEISPQIILNNYIPINLYISFVFLWKYNNNNDIRMIISRTLIIINIFKIIYAKLLIKL